MTRLINRNQAETRLFFLARDGTFRAVPWGTMENLTLSPPPTQQSSDLMSAPMPGPGAGDVGQPPEVAPRPAVRVVVRLGIWSLTALLVEPRGFRLVIDDEALVRGLVAHDVEVNTRSLRELIPPLRQAVPRFRPGEESDMLKGRVYVFDLEEVTALLAAVGGPKVVPCIYDLREAFKMGYERVREVRRQWREDGEAEAPAARPPLPRPPIAPVLVPPVSAAAPPLPQPAPSAPAPGPVVRTVREPPGGFRAAPTATAPAPARKAHKPMPLPDLQLTPEEAKLREQLPSIKGLKDTGAFKAREVERIRKALELMGWHRMKAALLLEMPRRTFYRKAIGYGVIVIEKATRATAAGKARKAG